MAKKLTVVLSQGQSAAPAKRQLEEQLVAALLVEPSVEVVILPNLYDLAPDGTGALCLTGIAGDMVVLSWLYPRAAHWTLDRLGILGQVGTTLLKGEEEEEEEDDLDGEPSDGDDASSDEPDKPRVVDARPRPARNIYCLDLRWHGAAEPYLEEICRIAREATVQTVELLGWINGQPRPEQLDRYLNADDQSLQAAPVNGPAAPADAAMRVDEATNRRWYPVIDYSRCTNCMECIDFCLFGVYGTDQIQTILVEQPDNCRKGCPACSRVCPENAIIFPQHKTPEIAGSPAVAEGGFKIDLSQLFGAPNALDQAVLERDTELVAVGRDAVGATIGMPKRRQDGPQGPKDDLDHLMDQLDSLDL